jgi:ribonuclease R
MVHITDLGADYFQYDDARHELRGDRTGKRFQLTDRVDVQVVRVDLESRKIDLRLAGADAPPPRPEKPSKDKDRKGNIKPGPTTSQRHEVKTTAPKSAPSKPSQSAQPSAPQPAAKPASRSRGGRGKTNAAASAAVAPRAAKPASKSKKKR